MLSYYDLIHNAISLTTAFSIVTQCGILEHLICLSSQDLTGMDIYSNKEVLVGRVVFDPTLSHKTSYLPTVRNDSDSDTLFPLTPADFDEVLLPLVQFAWLV